MIPSIPHLFSDNFWDPCLYSISPQKYEASDQIGDERTHKAYSSL